ncbi:MAG: hypothetical protein AAGG53_08420 [Cyanobacteria bacterium P01_H01_bin.152]
MGAEPLPTARQWEILAPSHPADILLLDYGLLSRDVVPLAVDPWVMVLARAVNACVEALWVDGRLVVRHGTVVSIDEPAIAAEPQVHRH